MEQRGREVYSWEELVEKAVDADAKAGLLPTSLVREMNQQCVVNHGLWAVRRPEKPETRLIS